MDMGYRSRVPSTHDVLMEPSPVTEQSLKVAAMFDAVAETYDTVAVPWFGPIAEGLVERLAPCPGERALDLGTGRGAALWPLASGVAPGGAVTGLDLSEQMIATARSDIVRHAAAGDLAPIELLRGDATAPELPETSFDLAVASLVLFFLPEPATALRSWYGLLVPGGRLGISTFAARDASWDLLDDVFTAYLPPALLDARTSGSRGPFASDEGVSGLLEASGFVDVETQLMSLPVHFADVEQWRAWTWSHGQRSHWLPVPVEARDSVLAEATRRLAPIMGPDGGFTLTQQVRYTLGRRPA